MSLDIIVEKVRDGFDRHVRVRQEALLFSKTVYNNKDVRD